MADLRNFQILQYQSILNQNTFLITLVFYNMVTDNAHLDKDNNNADTCLAFRQ